LETITTQELSKREARLAYSRQYYKDHAEQYKENCRIWRSNNPEKTKASGRKSELRKYGLTPDKYDTMLAEQQFKCAICGSDGNGKRLHVDHCHTTNAVRGILCSYCNHMLGHARDNPTILLAGAQYLERHSI
jgi:DNA-directed RNA polymerase subunit RPC12/RpoP